tara:strand:+ start:694 stop:1458 length:765 start_codon:yes stop_codon:yes gene_type:complete
MTLIEAITLGVIQGITEFLPISSSGHLVLGQALLGIVLPGNEFEVITHLGTLLSVFCFFWTDIIKLFTGIRDIKTQKYILYLTVATIPAVVVGLTSKSFISVLFESIKMVSISLIFTGLILFLSQKLIQRFETMTIKKGLLIGLSQAIAIIPGISRSGMTISMGLALGISGKEAAKFSFLLAIPSITGAGILTLMDTSFSTITIPESSLIAAFLSSFIIGYLSLKWLFGLLESGKFHLFGYYCILIGILTLVTM